MGASICNARVYTGRPLTRQYSQLVLSTACSALHQYGQGADAPLFRPDAWAEYTLHFYIRRHATKVRFAPEPDW